MLKRLLLSASVLLSVNLAVAQQLPNNDFEDWTLYNWYSNLNGFFTNNGELVYRGGQPGVELVSDAYSGQKAVRLRTQAIAGDTLYSVLYIGDEGSEGSSGGKLLRKKPLSLNGYVKTDLRGGEAFLIVQLFDAGNDPIGFGSFTFGRDIPSYEPFRVNLMWFDFDPDVKAEYYSFALISGSDNNVPLIAGSSITVDSLYFISNDTAIFENGDFEIFENQVSREPNEWTSSNYKVLGLGNLAVERDTMAYSGGRCVRITNRRTHGGFQDAFITNQSILDGQFSGGLPLSNNPASLKGYYQFSTSAVDSATVVIMTNQIPDMGFPFVQDSIVAMLPPANEWTEFEIPFTYSGTDTVEQLALWFYAGNINQRQVHAGNTLKLDALSITYANNAATTYLGELSLTVYPNPARNVLMLKAHFAGAYEWNLLDGQGRTVANGRADSDLASISVDRLVAGSYYLHIMNKEQIRTFPVLIQR
jgi:hypothetical protein